MPAARPMLLEVAHTAPAMSKVGATPQLPVLRAQLLDRVSGIGRSGDRADGRGGLRIHARPYRLDPEMALDNHRGGVHKVTAARCHGRGVAGHAGAGR